MKTQDICFVNNRILTPRTASLWRVIPPPLNSIFLSLIFLSALSVPAADWQPAVGPLKTRWAKDVSPANAHPEYPRPQMVRKDWLNLNGLWDFAITSKEATHATCDAQILVPFPVESALSGVMGRVSENERIWYRRTFEVPRKWQGRRLLLHFGAVDFETTVWVNGTEVGHAPRRLRRHLASTSPMRSTP